MTLPQISIHQQYAKINMSSKSASQEISQPTADLEIKQPRGKLEIEHRDVKVEIDNYPTRFDLGYKNITDFRKSNIQYANDIVMKKIAQYAQQGDQLMKIENKGNALQDVIREDATPEKKEIGLKWIRGPKFNVIPPELNINYTSGKPEINAKVNPPQYKYHKGQVDIRVAQYGKVEIHWAGHLLNQMV